MQKVQIKYTIDGLEVITPFSARFLTELKRLVPSAERRWRKPAWIVDQRHEKVIVDLVKAVFGDYEPILNDEKLKDGGLVPLAQSKQIEVSYIGSCKQRDAGESTAFGWAEGDWNIIFPERVLRTFFNAGTPSAQTNATSMYGLLGIESTAPETEIKSAYRRAARQWHPDVNSEPDAAMMFRRITDAYQILSDPKQRKRYDAGLALESYDQRPDEVSIAHLAAMYRAPFTCGLITFKGHRSLGRWIVDEIVSWDDIVNEQGQAMVSVWDKLAEKFEISWVSRDYEVEL